MKKPIKPRGKQHDALAAASFKRIAKALRVRARNHARAANKMSKARVALMDQAAHFELIYADIYAGLAQDFDHEASTPRAMR